MDKEELAKLHVIDDLWYNLNEEPKGQITRRGVEEPDGNRFVRNARTMANEVSSLCELFSPDYYSLDLAGINSTLKDEIKRVEFAQGRYSQKRTQKNKDILTDHMNNALGHLLLDFYGIFQKIQELKNNEEWDI